MRFGPGIPEEEYGQALLAEVTATFGEERAEADGRQLQAAARALRLIAQVDVRWTAEDPFFLGVPRDG